MPKPIPVYCIPGLGADERVFARLQLPEGFEAVHLKWIRPEKGEPLAGYARRLSAGINHQEPFVLLGLSMGGMVAAEIAAVYKPLCLVLLSSIPVSRQLPYYYRWAGAIRLPQVIPIRLLQAGSLVKRIFTTEAPEEKKLVQQMVRDSDPAFIRWAMNAIVQWKGNPETDSRIHIHGTGDGLLPLRFTDPTHLVKKAGHLMVLTHAAAVNEILRSELGKLYASGG